MDKRKKYETLIARLDDNIDSGHFFEASWYASGVIEDRLLSLLRLSGGVPTEKNGKEVRTIGRKIGEVKKRLGMHAELTQVLPLDVKDNKGSKSNSLIERLNTWKNLRNELMHELGDSTIEISSIDSRSPTLASEGRDVARELSATVYRLKKKVR